MKRNVRLIAVFLIAVQMFMLCSSCFAETATQSVATLEYVDFEPYLLSQVIIDLTIDDCYGSNSSRAIFAAILSFDFGIHSTAENKYVIDMESAFSSNSAYVAKSGSNLVVYIDDNTHQVVMMYNFLTETGAYIYVDGLRKTTVQSVLDDLCDSCYEIDSDLLSPALVHVYKILESKLT